MYNYKKEKEKIFTETGQVMFLQIRDRVKELLKISGTFMLWAAIEKSCGDTYLMIACLDRLVELNEIKEIEYGNVPGQNRIFVSNK